MVYYFIGYSNFSKCQNLYLLVITLSPKVSLSLWIINLYQSTCCAPWRTRIMMNSFQFQVKLGLGIRILSSNPFILYLQRYLTCWRDLTETSERLWRGLRKLQEKSVKTFLVVSFHSDWWTVFQNFNLGSTELFDLNNHSYNVYKNWYHYI